MLRRRLRKYKPAVVVKVAPDDESKEQVRGYEMQYGRVGWNLLQGLRE